MWLSNERDHYTPDQRARMREVLVVLYACVRHTGRVPEPEELAAAAGIDKLDIWDATYRLRAARLMGWRNGGPVRTAHPHGLTREGARVAAELSR